MAEMNYLEAVNFLTSFPDMERGTHGARGATMSLDAMRALLARLDNPQNGRQTVHVTGSKGKGSTSTMISSILKAAGLRTALYTSPHLHHYTERIAIDLQPVSESKFAHGLAQIKEKILEAQETGSTISTFGILTALFFHLAKIEQPPVDWQVVEVGLGGRFDATNVFATKEAAVITAISLEHIEILGTNQSEIATNKAGIITPGCVAIVGPQKDPAVRSVIGRRAHEVGADLVYVPKAYKIKTQSHDFGGQRFTLEGPHGVLDLHTRMLGEHQVRNAATAVATAKALAERGAPISDEAIVQGLSDANIEGRFELLTREPVNGRGQPPSVVLDGAHNHESAAALAICLKALFPEKKWVFVIGINRDKNINAIWRELLPLSHMVIATQSSNPRAMDAEQLAEALSFQSSLSHVQATACDNIAQAVEQALANGDSVCVTGSLYVVADARAHLKKNEFNIAQGDPAR